MAAAGGDVVVFRAWRSPFSHRVELALKMKGVEYHLKEEDIPFNKSPELLKYNPVHKKIPVLLHGGNPICESLVILEYIDETWKDGNPILPQDPYERAMARFWSKFIDEKCVGALWKSCWTEGETQQKIMEEAKGNLKTLESALEGKKFFGGETIGLVDITAGFIAYWVGVLQEVAGVSLLEEDKFPILCNWTREYLNCDVVKESLPPREKLLAFFQSRKEVFLHSFKAPK